MVPEIGLGGLLLDPPHSGTAVYTRNLVPLLPVVAPDLGFRLFVRVPPVEDLGVKVQPLLSPVARFNHGTGTGARLDKLAWETLSLPLAALRFGESLIHSLYFAVPLVKPVPVVVTIHDVIPLVVHGYHRGPASSVYAQLMARAVRDAAAVITVSEYSRIDILRTLRVPEHRVFVTPEAADARFSPQTDSKADEIARRQYDLPDRFFLVLGGAERRKNLELILEAWSLVEAGMREREISLLVVARFPPPDSLYPDIPSYARSLGLQSSVRFLPTVDEVDKPSIYRLALGFCFPSRYEGFGLPPLEALASGTPVIASSATSIPEVVGDAGWLLDPDDPRAWSEAMLRLADSPVDRQDLANRGVVRARTFSWRRTAEATASVYREVLGA